MTVTITHSRVTGAPANPNVLVDGPAWDAEHVVTGLAPSATVDTTNASNITSGTLPAAQLPASPTFAGPAQVTNTTASTSTTTGALTVAGGAGVAGALNVGGTITGSMAAIGAALAPDSTLTVNANTGASVAPAAGTSVHFIGATGSNIVTLDAYGASNIVFARMANGTQAAKTVPVSGSQILIFQGQGWDSSAYSTGCNFQLRATETWNTGAHGAEIAFKTVPNGTAPGSLNDAVVIKNSGGLAIGNGAADPGTGCLNVAGTTASTTPTTGAATIAGGLGVAGDQFGGGKIVSTSASGGVGYAAGAGGTVTQGTSRTTGVTLNKTTGQITLFTAAPAVGTWVSFTLTNSNIAATDVVVVNFKSGTNTYIGHVSAVAAGSCQISFTSIAGTSSDAPVINFAVIKGANS